MARLVFFLAVFSNLLTIQGRFDAFLYLYFNGNSELRINYNNHNRQSM